MHGHYMQTWRHAVDRKYITYYVVVREGRNKPRLEVISAENVVKFGRVVFEIREQIDRQTCGRDDRYASHC